MPFIQISSPSTKKNILMVIGIILIGVGIGVWAGLNNKQPQEQIVTTPVGISVVVNHPLSWGTLELDSNPDVTALHFTGRPDVLVYSFERVAEGYRDMEGSFYFTGKPTSNYYVKKEHNNCQFFSIFSDQPAADCEVATRGNAQVYYGIISQQPEFVFPGILIIAIPENGTDIERIDFVVPQGDMSSSMLRETMKEILESILFDS